MTRSLRLAALAFLFTTSLARAEMVPWRAELNGASVVPPVEGSAKGELEASYDTLKKELTWTLTYSGLSSPVVSAHIHGPGAPGKTAPVLLPLAGPYESPVKGSITLTTEQADALKRGVYVDVHTQAHPDGEIRGELK